ncbi:uncharacterized protein LOC136070307 [Quercus suber]|uniref:uncharacterized protein LOC136070307 n=1 Tax=Quercus suber TaxID=58331 RepID=UPI0032DF3C1A
MGDDESFDSFYGKLNEIIIAKFNLGEKIEDNKVVRKILRSLPESFRAKVIAIEESKDLDEINIQELIGSLQTYELGLPSHKTSKSLALKTITERMDNPSEEDGVDKDVAYLVKNFRKFLKFKNGGKFGDKGKFQSSGREKKEFRRKDDRDSQSPQRIICFECNGHRHFKKECPNYLKSKGKVYATTLSDSDSSNSNSEESCDGEGNYFAFMTIAHVETSEDLDILVKELDKSELGYAGGSSSSANVIKEVKFVKAKETTVDRSNPEKIKAEKKKNVADQRVLHKSSNQSESRYGARGRSLPRQQQGPRMESVCHYCGLQGHTRPNCQRLRADNNASASRSRGRRNDIRTWGGEQPRSQKRDPGMMDVMKMICAFTNCLESFTRRFDSPNSRTRSVKDITPNAHDVWVTKGTHA